jgi:hypothetical protein
MTTPHQHDVSHAQAGSGDGTVSPGQGCLAPTRVRDPLWLPSSRTPVAEAALIYAQHGLPVFPVRPDKRPLTPHGLHDASADPVRIADWWEEWPGAGIGWPVAKGLVVIDIDARHHGHESLDQLEREYARLPQTLTQVTGGGGLHLLFRVPEGLEVRQLAGLRSGIDTRAAGRGYIVLPPSVHLSGLRYDWRERVRPVDAPAWLIDLIRTKPAPPIAATVPPPSGTDRRSRYAAAVLRGEAEAVAATAEGGRNHRLFRAWRRCATDLADVLPREIVIDHLTAAARLAGLPPTEIERTLR